MTYFNNLESLSELKKVYRSLAMANHPDKGGSLEVMQRINAEYDEVFNIIKNKHNKDAGEGTQMPIHEMPEEFRNIIMAIINLEGLEIELCGNWIWISGDTKQHKDTLKELKFFWANKKKMWYWRNEKDNARGNRKSVSMDIIREKYGSERVSINNKFLTA